MTRLVIARASGIAAWSKAWRHNKALGVAVLHVRAGDLVVRTGTVDVGFGCCLPDWVCYATQYTMPFLVEVPE